MMRNPTAFMHPPHQTSGQNVVAFFKDQNIEQNQNSELNYLVKEGEHNVDVQYGQNIKI